MHGTFRPRRIAIFLVLLVSAGSLGVTAAGFAPTSSQLPGNFQPAQPLAGDKAEWAFSVVDAAGLSKNALAFFRMEERAPISTWNRSGDVHTARVVHFEEAAHGMHSSTGTTPVDFSWYFRSTEAQGPDGIYWYASHDHQQHHEEVSSESYMRRFLDGDSSILRNCLLKHLPPGADLRGPMDLGGCIASGPAAHPDRTMTGSQISAGAGKGWGAFLIGGAWHAIGQSATPHGSAVVLEYRVKGESNGVRAWFTQALPYPVQLTVEGNGKTWIHQVTAFERGAAAPAPTPIEPLPAARERPARPWGPDDAGLDVPLRPSKALEVARADAALGLQAWLDDHPNAFVEYAAGGHLGGGDADWTMQYRAGSQRFAFRVVRETVVPSVPAVFPLYEDRSEMVETVDVQDSPEAAPIRLPDYASAAARFEAATGQVAQRWTFGWACTDWVRHGPCQGRSGPVVDAAASVSEQTMVLGLDGVDHVWTDWTFESSPGGGVAGAGWRRTTIQQDAPLAERNPAEAPHDIQATSTGAWAAPAGRTVAQIGTGAAVTALLYLSWPLLKAAPVALFSRVRRGDLLDHPNRKRLYQAIQQQPGIHLTALVAMLGQGRGTVEHHLKKLEDERLVKTRLAKGYRCFFIQGTDRRIMEVAPALRSDTAQRVLRHVRENPGATGGGIASTVGVNRATVSHHVRRLETAGLLRSEREGTSVKWWPVASMVAVAAPMIAA